MGPAIAKWNPEERDALLLAWQNRDAAFGMLNYYPAQPESIVPLMGPRLFEVPAVLTPRPLLPNN